MPFYKSIRIQLLQESKTEPKLYRHFNSISMQRETQTAQPLLQGTKGESTRSDIFIYWLVTC